MSRVHVGSHWLSLDSIRTYDELPLQQYDQKAIDVMRGWLEKKREYTFQTSGSTGPPKSITFRRDQLEASAMITIQAFKLRPGMSALVCLDANFIAGAMMIIRALVAGMDLLIRRPTGDPLSGLSVPIDFAAFVPLQLASSLRNSRQQLDRIGTAIIGGAPLSPKIVDQIQSVPGALYATYGMTETLTHIALQRLNGPHRQESFHLLPGINASIDERGCIVIQAPHLGSNPVVTNDCVEFTGATFRIVGRNDHVINSGGIKIHPEKIESAVHETWSDLGLEFRFFISGRPDEQLGQRLCLVVEAPRQSQGTEVHVLDSVAKRLGKYETPREIFWVSRFIETGSGKIDRAATLKTIEE